MKMIIAILVKPVFAIISWIYPINVEACHIQLFANFMSNAFPLGN